ncbi:LuxR C-terminal-related transcriptional regulator [Kutzneria sp. NPDC052558]|uniref:LuxR C-terminal-related transcriptional regulator n=1 Tax=Kutzneria sp. NPDC052558 TaxID=3364121 RepID=UPI0037CA7263
MLGNQPVNVVVQHQNVMIRELLATQLAAEPGITVAGAVASGPDLIQLCHLCRPHVALFEADGLRWSNERLVALLLEHQPQLRLVGLHDSLTAAYVVKACAAGVSAMVSYSRGLDALLAAIGSADADVAEQALTTRELEVLYLSRAGYPPQQVAHELGTSVRSVQSHKRRILARAGQSTPVELPRQKVSGPGVRVIARAAGDPIAERVRRVLHAHGIPVVGANERRAAVVLIDPAPEDWPAIPVEVEVPIVVASRPLPRHYALEALTAGVAVVPAEDVDRLMVPAVRAAGRGHLTVDAAHVRGALRGPYGTRRSWWRREILLTKREREILGSMERGQSAKDAAAQLGISVRTVENLRNQLFRKLGVHTRAAALAAAKELGLLGTSP